MFLFKTNEFDELFSFHFTGIYYLLVCRLKSQWNKPKSVLFAINELLPFVIKYLSGQFAWNLVKKIKQMFKKSCIDKQSILKRSQRTALNINQ